MSDSSIEAFGVSEAEASATNEWIQKRTATVVGDDGRGGSGVYLELENASRAVLTARHVVLRAIISGELTIAPLGWNNTRSVPPRTITIHAEVDAALLRLQNNEDAPEYLSYAEWACQEPSSLEQGTAVICSGAVGEWKTTPDLSTRIIELTMVPQYWTSIVRAADEHGAFCADIDEKKRPLPLSFAGMSGGPFFSLSRRLLGILTTELRNISEEDGLAVGQTLASMALLFPPYDPPTLLGEAHEVIEDREILIGLVDHRRTDDNTPIPVFIRVQLLRSQSTSEGNNARDVVRAYAVQIMEPPRAREYIINVEAVATRHGTSDEDLKRDLRPALESMFAGADFSLVLD